jgi:hypothetical protein
MGPTPGSTPRGRPIDPARYPMPDAESKPRPRHSYRNGAIPSHMAHVNKTYKAGLKEKDDGRHMFFQFEMAPEVRGRTDFSKLRARPHQTHGHDQYEVLSLTHALRSHRDDHNMQ